jgi:hypothetical protein
LHLRVFGGCDHLELSREDELHRRKQHRPDGARRNSLCEIHFAALGLKAFFIDHQVVADFAREAGLPGVPHLRVAQISDPALFAALDSTATSIQTGETALEQQVRFVEFLAGVLGYAENAPGDTVYSHGHAAIRRSRDLLQARFNETVTLSELAAVSRLSRFHLARCFSDGLGLPPHA